MQVQFSKQECQELITVAQEWCYTSNEQGIILIVIIIVAIIIIIVSITY